MKTPFSTDAAPDCQGLLDCIARKGTPSRVHFMELFIDPEVQQAICERYGLLDDFNPDDASFNFHRQVALQSFLGYDFVSCGLGRFAMPMNRSNVSDTAGLARQGGRSFMNEQRGPITNWDEFEAYPWPDPESLSTRWLEWYQENLPEGMCIAAFGGIGHFAEHLTWLMGYETLCIALFEQRDLVAAISDRLTGIFRANLERILQFDRVKLIWGPDDMGFRGGTLISPDDLREFALPGHKLLARMSHDAGRPYLLHSCGNLSAIMDDLIEDVKIDAKHSFEDTIEHVTDAKRAYGDRIAILGGIDVDFLCRASEDAIRQRVRDTLGACMDGGGYCLGTGNSVTNYIPIENYLAMLDEGRRFAL